MMWVTLYTASSSKGADTIRATKPHPRVQRLALTKARNALGAVVKRVHLHKEYVILEKDGIPLAAMMDVDEFEDYLEIHDPRVRAIIHQGTEEYRAGKSRPARELLKELQARVGRRVARRRHSA